MMEEILGFLSKQRQILLYSATFPLSVQKFMVKISICFDPTFIISDVSTAAVCFVFFLDFPFAETL